MRAAFLTLLASLSLGAPCIGHPLQFTANLGAPGYEVAWSPDGTRVASGSGGTVVQIWNASSNSLLKTLSGHKQSVLSVAWSLDGTQLASAAADGLVKIWNVSSEECVRTFSHANYAMSVAWSSDSTRLSSGAVDNLVKIWNVSSGQLLNLIGHSNYVASVAWSPDDMRVASGSADKSVKIWNATSGAVLMTLNEHTDWVGSVAWNMDGTRVVSGSLDKLIKIWDTSTGACLQTFLSGHTNGVTSVAWSSDGVRVASGSHDSLIKIWDVSSGVCLKTLSGHSDLVLSVAWSPDGTRLASGSRDESMRIWDASFQACVKTFTGHSDSVLGVAWNRDGVRVASGSSDGSVKIWNISSGRTLLTIPVAPLVYTVAWSPDGTRLASGSFEDVVRIFNASSGQLLLNLTGHSDSVFSVAWSGDGTRLVSMSDDGWVKLWNASGQSLLSWYVGSAPWGSVVWSLDDTRVASSHGSRTIIWNASSGEVLRTLSGHSMNVNSVAWNPDGICLASGSSDMSIKIWNGSSGDCLMNLTGHTGSVWSLAWNPDGSRLASSSGDASVKIWDAVSGRCLKTLSGHSGLVRSVAWSLDGSLLASGAIDKLVKIWHPRTLAFSVAGSITPTFAATGGLLDQNLLVQIYRAGNERQWLDCQQAQLLGSHTNVTATFSSLLPGLYGVSYYDQQSGDAVTPWTNFTPFTVPCPVGHEATFLRESNASCIPCGTATYARLESLSQCALCIGQVNADSTACDPCLNVAYFNGSHCACRVKYYPLNSTQCAECPLHATCTGTDFFAADGFWRVANSTSFLRCSNQEACVEGTCHTGYEGILCGECMVGYGQYQRLCQECPDPLESVLVLLASTIVFACLFSLFVYKTMQHKKGKAQFVVSALKVGFSAAQVNSMLLGLGVRLTSFPEFMLAAQQTIASGGLETLSLSCAFLTFGIKPEHVFFATSLVWLLIGPVVALVCVFVHACCRRCRQFSLRQLLITSACCFMFTFHTNITLQTFQMFSCRPVDLNSEQYHLSADASVECYTLFHWAYMLAVGVPLLICYVIAPPLTALWYLRKTEPDGVNEIQFLSSEFQIRWWFLVVLARKVLVAAFMAYGGVSTPALQGLAIAIMLLCFLVVQSLVSPYVKTLQKLNVVEALSLLSSASLFLIVAVVFVNPDQVALREDAGVALTSIMMGFYCLLAIVALQGTWKQRRSPEAVPLLDS